MAIRVTVWNEFRHEKKNETVKAIYPNGIHTVIAAHLKTAGMDVKTATLDEPDHGISEDVVNNTDVLVWWGHGAHGEVSDGLVDKLQKKILSGMGLLTLHSGHHSKIFKRMMGTTCDLKWRVAGEREVLWVIKPSHPILAGITDHMVLPEEEMYGEYFDVPEPEELLMISNFTGGQVFRSCMTWQRGRGRICYFRPGHETYPTYKDANVAKIIVNAVKWLAPAPGGVVAEGCPNPKNGLE